MGRTLVGALCQYLGDVRKHVSKNWDVLRIVNNSFALSTILCLETLMEKEGQLDSLCSEAAGVVRSLIKDCRIPVEFVRIEAEDRHPDEERGEHNRAAFHRARRLATKGAEDGENTELLTM